MIYFLFVVGVLLFLIAILSLSIWLGKKFGKARLAKHPDHKLELDGIAESAVFGLLALFIAFSFSGAYERLERRKMHIIDEANSFLTAYQYLDLLDTDSRVSLKSQVREYLDLHLAEYLTIPDLPKVESLLVKSKHLESAIWDKAVASCEANSNKSLMILLMPAVDEMFREAQTGINMSKVHPPFIIFILLIGLAAAGAFLLGYNSAENKQSLPIHVLCYVLLTAVTIYIIINIEFPRAGFVRLNYFDQILVEAAAQMSTNKG